MKHILVTGVGGNVGQYVAQKLYDEGYIVTGIYRNSIPQNVGYELIKADLSETVPRLSDVDVVIHIAACIRGTAKELIRDNIKTTENLITFAEQAHIKTFIYMSTVSVYGEVVGELCENSDIKNPENYGITKYLSEQILRESSIQKKIVIQLPRMLGPFVDMENIQGSGFLTMTRKLLMGDVVHCFVPNVRYNNYLHVDNLVRFLIHLLEENGELENEKILLGVQERLMMIEILEIMKEEIDSNARIIAEDNGTIPMCALVNINKAKKMGFVPYSADETLRKFIKEIRCGKL